MDHQHYHIGFKNQLEILQETITKSLKTLEHPHHQHTGNHHHLSDFQVSIIKETVETLGLMVLHLRGDTKCKYASKDEKDTVVEDTNRYACVCRDCLDYDIGGLRDYLREQFDPYCEIFPS